MDLPDQYLNPSSGRAWLHTSRQLVSCTSISGISTEASILICFYRCLYTYVFLHIIVYRANYNNYLLLKLTYL